MTWTTAKRQADKGWTAIEGAIEHLRWSDPDPLWEGNVLPRTEDALKILEEAGKRINADLTATRKALGVGVYRPYGRNDKPFGRR